MPIYAFTCDACGTKFDLMRPMRRSKERARCRGCPELARRDHAAELPVCHTGDTFNFAAFDDQGTGRRIEGRADWKEVAAAGADADGVPLELFGPKAYKTKIDESLQRVYRERQGRVEEPASVVAERKAAWRRDVERARREPMTAQEVRETHAACEQANRLFRDAGSAVDVS